MKKLLLFVLLPLAIFAQESYVGELRIDLINCSGSINYNFTLTEIGARWDENYNLTEDYSTASDVVTSCTGYAAFDHVLDPSTVNDTFAVGIYKISAIENDEEQAYFYMDWRTSDWSASLDVQFNYDVGNNRFRDWDNTETIDYSYQTLWDLTNNGLETSGLEDYWENCLVLTSDADSHPRLIWGPHPSFTTTHFYVYRAITSQSTPPPFRDFSLLGTTSSSCYNFTDSQFTIGGGSSYAHYLVKAYNSSTITFSSATNTVNSSGVYNTEKIAVNSYKKPQPMYFELKQNYPNPFNPSTVISWYSPVNDFVTLKLFDVLGREVMTVMDE